MRTRLAFTEPDWKTCVVAGASAVLSRTVIANWLSRNRNATVGRQLAGLPARLGLTLDRLDGRAVCYRELDEADRVFPLHLAGAQAAADVLITAADLAQSASEPIGA